MTGAVDEERFKLDEHEKL